MKLKFLIPLLVFILLSFFFYLGLKSNPNNLPSALLNQPFPAFVLSELQAPKKEVNQTIFSNHVSLLNVWASWCSACREEHAVLQKISQDYSNKIKIYGLNYKDQHKDALQWLKHLGNPYSIVIEDPNGLLGMDLGVYGTPETFIIDRQGIIRYKHVGPINIQVWQDILYPKILELL